MIERTVRVGIIGCGGIAHGKHLPSLAKLPHVELVAFCDLVKDRATAAAGKYGIAGAGVYTEYKRLLADKSIEVVHVLTPNKSHSEISIAALEAGKHVLCEKPMAKTAADARLMLEAALRTGKKLSIAYQHRHKPESVYLRNVIRRGDLGEIYFAKSYAVRRRGTPNWGVFLNEEEQGGGPLIDIGTHSLDLTLNLMNNYKPKMVVGTTFKKLPNPDCANPWGPWDVKQHTVEDSAFGFIVMENGATIILEASWALNTIEPIQEGSVVLCGTLAGAQIKNGLSINKDEFGQLIEIKPELKTGGVAFYDGKSESPADREARLWIEAVVEGTEPEVKPEQALVVSEILEALYESARTGKPVYLGQGRA